jgi:hypothetical protein
MSNRVSAGNPPSAREEERALANLLRDIFGNPFSPVALERTCQTNDVVELAEVIYDKSDFRKLPALAKALREAGCSDKTILTHCRTKGPHVRGCSVVDLVLEKRGGRT